MGNPPGDDAVGKGQWRRITATVKPLKQGLPELPAKVAPEPRLAPKLTPKPTPRPAPAPAVKAIKANPSVSPAARTLDGRWDRSLRDGRIDPDIIVDLHGHRVASAHAHLSRRIENALSQGARVMLVIAGKVRGADEAPRGAIRRELDHWLMHGPHAGRIAAVRNAHPRHGGAGAVYVIFRRPEPVR